MAVEYNINILKASNGWVIRTFDSTKPGSHYIDIMVVADDKDLAGMLAAALVADRLRGSEASPNSSRLVWGPSYSPPSVTVSNGIINNSMLGSGTIGAHHPTAAARHLGAAQTYTSTSDDAIDAFRNMVMANYGK